MYEPAGCYALGMPEVRVRVGTHNLVVSYDDGDHGFLRVSDADRGVYLHLEEGEDGTLIASHIAEAQTEPANEFDFDVKSSLDEALKGGESNRS